MTKSLLFDFYNAAEDWRCQAACRDTDPDLFFPVGSTGLALEQIESAKVVCQQCNSQTACLEFALATNQDSGVWGGKSEDERRQLRRLRVAEQRQAPIFSV
ncbi:WhiB family transcriptional regulator [Candidatus Poriferisocius sp.]|uniref:WhiB family transcriptional regulator n=1 Tax=Candidatus Poriferisocius sp. TaxID=3101276 RepID=UPI003B01AB31